MPIDERYQEPPKTLKDYSRIILRSKYWVIFFTIIVFSFTFFKTFSTIPVYKSGAVLMIEDKSQVATVFNFGERTNSYTIANEIEIIKSRFVAESVVKELWNSKHRNNLYIFGTRKFKPRGQRARRFVNKVFPFGLLQSYPDSVKKYNGTLTEEIIQSLTGAIRKSAEVSNRQKTNVLDISMVSASPEEAKLLTNTFVHAYQKSDRELSSTEIKGLKQFLIEQLDKKEKELAHAEEAVKKYQEEELVFGLDAQASLILGMASNAETQFYSTQAEINITRHNKEYIESQLSEEEKTLAEKLANSINTRLAAFQNEIGQKEAELIRSSSMYGLDHDAVKQLQRDIKGLKQKLSDETERLIVQGISIANPLEYSQELIQKVLTIEAELAGLNSKSAEYKKLVNMYNSQLEALPEKQLNYARLERDRTVLNETYRFMRQKLEETNISEASEAGKVRIIDYASPGEKISPKVKQELLIGLILGLGIGIAFVLFKDYLNNTLKSVEEIERTGLTILGVIPLVPEMKSIKYKNGIVNSISKNFNMNSSKKTIADDCHLITHYDPKSPISEAFRTIRTNVMFSSADKEIKSIVISSPGPGEGKTTIVCNLAITFANLGKRTLLIDTDLRRSTIHKIFEIPKEPGIIQYLAGSEKDFESLIRTTPVENLYIVTSGGTPPNPSELLGSNRMAELIARLETEWDMVLLDSPPIVAVTDATMISKEIDQIILMAMSGKTDKNTFIRSVNLLRQIDAPLGGAILNGISKATSYDSYYYYYKYYHYSSDGEKKAQKKHRRKVKSKE